MKKEKITPKSISRKPILKSQNLHKKYNEGKSNEVHALRGINLTVNKET
jgi:ABC-type oligopeptide transport system ATPase subunit